MKVIGWKVQSSWYRWGQGWRSPQTSRFRRHSAVQDPRTRSGTFGVSHGFFHRPEYWIKSNDCGVTVGTVATLYRQDGYCTVIPPTSQLLLLTDLDWISQSAAPCHWLSVAVCTALLSGLGEDPIPSSNIISTNLHRQSMRDNIPSHMHQYRIFPIFLLLCTSS